MREFLEAGGRASSFDEKRTALISILPPAVRKDVIMNVHLVEPTPGASPYEQELAFAQLRSRVRKQTELIAQFERIIHPVKTAETNVLNSASPWEFAESGDDILFPEPAADDIEGQELYAVYQKGLKAGKGKGKGFANAPQSSL